MKEIATLLSKRKLLPFTDSEEETLTTITTYALFYNEEYLTNEQMNDGGFLKLLAKQLECCQNFSNSLIAKKTNANKISSNNLKK